MQLGLFFKRSHIGHACLCLSLATSLFWEEYCLICLAVVHWGRAVPLAWRVVEHAIAYIPCAVGD
ncbi:MAG: hypothetical protein DCF25_10910 [Leptolyngbya foveolarum]|uniref:Secreted protein n=1 Tax=Leptolyngbya foveolarum TaxID=47253 RepID=A0A2W4UEW2_9CYAN|nr:MAG: hypothetical protein DCF25_10910 [Leptolyngbya foveolarum]